MKAMILGAPNPIMAPMIAMKRCDLALAFPKAKLMPAHARPSMEARGKMVLMSVDCMLLRVDSTLASTGKE